MSLTGARSLGRLEYSASDRKNSRLAPPQAVEHMQFPFRQWDGPIGPWEEHFGKGRGQVHSIDGTEPLRSCNEVEVAKALRRMRDHAYWISPFNTTRMPSLWRPWVLSMRELPAWLAEIDAAIRLRIHSHSGGMPDVVAWNDTDPVRSALFVECKGPRESFKEAQEDWLFGALAEGLTLDQFAVSVRPF